MSLDIRSNITCRVCCAPETKVFFSRRNTPFWYGMLDDAVHDGGFDSPHNATLVWCPQCGFIGLDLNEELRAMIRSYYGSSHSCPCATHGQQSNYSQALTYAFLDCYDRLGGDARPDRVLEIGCQSGYLLDLFRQRGSGRILGVEPGDIAPYQGNDGPVEILRGSFGPDLVQEDGFDLIYALQVFEHIEQPCEFLDLARTLLAPQGRLLLAVPNEEHSLLHGNLGMVMLQHFNYFTPVTLTHLLANRGFRILGSITRRDSSLYVLAEKDSTPREPVSLDASGLDVLVEDFSRKVDENLHRVRDIVNRSDGATGFYGVNGSLPNIFSWLPELADEAIMIFDGDQFKWNRRFSGVPFPVSPPCLLNRTSDVLIVPFRLQEIIHDEISKSLPSSIWIHRLYQ